jgi:folate-binding Fe-S cluster repair protein YgfZ
MVLHLFLALTVSIKWRVLFHTLCWSIKTNSMVWELTQSNNLNTIAKLEKYKIYVTDTSRDKSRYFDIVPFTFRLTLTDDFRQL